MYNLTVHLKGHGRQLRYACNFCPEKFPDPKSLDDHLARFHPSERKPTFFCDFTGCEKSYFSWNHLLSHKRFHTSSHLACDVANCGKQFTKSSHLKHHESSHKDERKFVCTFENCQAKFKTSSKLHRHKKIHNKTNPLICDVCQKAFFRTEHLKAHQLTHSSERTFQCMVECCGKKFGARLLLLTHIRKVHGRQKEKTSSLLCPIAECSKRFINRETFESHLTNHGKDSQDNLIPDSQDSSQLDFVALLSSVGEDILLPDELSCPEYEITSDLGDKGRNDEVGESSSVNPPHVRLCELPAPTNVLDESERAILTLPSATENSLARVVLPDIDGGGGEIFISIQTDQEKSAFIQENVFTVVQSGYDTFSLPQVNAQVGQQQSVSNMSQTVQPIQPHGDSQPLSLRKSTASSTCYQQVGLLVDSVDFSQPVTEVTLDGTAKMTYPIGSNSLAAIESLDCVANTNRSTVMNQTLEEIVGEVTNTYMETGDDQPTTAGVSSIKNGVFMPLTDIDQPLSKNVAEDTLVSGGVSNPLTKAVDGAHLVESIIRHSTINLQDLK